MLRLSCVDHELKTYIGYGRSFYLCDKCISDGGKSIKKALSRACKREIKINDVEKILNG